MGWTNKGLGILLCIFSIAANVANALPAAWTKQDDNAQIMLRVDLFLTSTCAHCQAADKFFDNMLAKEKGLVVFRHYINKDKAALDLLQQYQQEQPKSFQLDSFAVPAVFFCQSRWVGFDSAATTGQKLLKYMAYCQQQIQEHGDLKPETINALRQIAAADLFESTVTPHYSGLSFVVMMALTDALNPCSGFCLFLILALLLMLESSRLRVRLGGMMLGVLLLVHLLQQFSPALYYQLLSTIRLPAILLGVALMGLSIHNVRTVCRDCEKSMIAFVIISLAAVFMVQTAQQRCVPNFAILFQQWLGQQHLTSVRYWLSSVVYQLIYVSALAMVIGILMLGLKKGALSNHGILIQRIGLVYLLLVGLLLVVSPALLSGFVVFFLILAVSILAGWILNRYGIIND